MRTVVAVPGSKSITNRALLLAALADAPSVLHQPLRSRDTDLMAAALRALGVDVTEARDGDWRITPHALRGPTNIACGLAGTVMRFVPPAAAIADGEIAFDGDEQARKRPMGTVLGALRTLGADITGDTLPFTVHGTGELAGGAVTIDASASSQFVSGLLLSGARYTSGVTVHHDGKPVPSMPHIEMTVDMLRGAGVEVDDTEPNTWRVAPGPIAGRDWDIEPDLSNATPFLAAAAVTGGAVTVTGWPARTTQPGDGIRAVLTEMGATVTLDERGLTVAGTGSLSGVDVDLHDIGELTPTIAALDRVRGRPFAAARHRAPAWARDRPARRAGQRDSRDRRRRGRDRGRADRAPPPVARRPVARLRRPPDGHRRRDHRPCRAWHRDRQYRDDQQDAARLSRYVAENAGRRVHNGGFRNVSELVSA